MDTDEFRKQGKELIDFIADYYDGIESRPVLSTVEPGYLRDLIPDEAPQEPEQWKDILGDVERVIMPGVTHWQSPNFFAYFPGNASFPGLLGDMVSGMINCVGFSWICSPACTELETIMMDWLAKMVGLPDTFLSSGRGGGVIQGTASEALLVALLAARAHARQLAVTADQGAGADRLTDGGGGGGGGESGGSDAAAGSATTTGGEEEDGDTATSGDSGTEPSLHEIDTRLVAYCSDQTHSSMQKACTILNIHLTVVPTTREDDYGLRGEALAAAVAADVAAGRQPFFLCATVGTTSSTAIDALPELGPICQEAKMWMHVDAAYAGTACVCPEFRHIIDGIEFAHSFNFNPHKWMMVNFDCSALWVTDRSTLTDAMSVNPEYLRNRSTESGLVTDYRDWQIPLGRRFRSLKMWFVFRAFGVTGLQAVVREHVRLAAEFESWVAADERFELVAPRPLALVCFRLRAPDAVNEALEHAINAAGRIFVIHTSLSGQYVLRFVVCTPRTEEKHVVAAWAHIQEIAAQVLAEAAAASDTTVTDGDEAQPEAEV